MITGNVEVKWEPGAEEVILNEVPDKMIYDIARMTLDFTQPHIPYLTGEMEKSTMAGGVKGSDKDYYIGSYTDYAKYVYVMGEKTNWTTPGTFGHWFSKTFEQYGQTILSNVVERDKLK